MERIIIISDTHKNQVLLRKAFSNEDNITHIFHLGDNYEDLDGNFDLTEGKEIIKIPGIFHPGYLNKSLQAIQTTEISGWKFLLIHNIEDLKNTTNEADFFLFGHTHSWSFEKKKNSYFINPGHLRKKSDKGRKPSYVVMDIDKDSITVCFKYVDGKVFRKEIINK